MVDIENFCDSAGIYAACHKFHHVSEASLETIRKSSRFPTVNSTSPWHRMREIRTEVPFREEDRGGNLHSMKNGKFRAFISESQTRCDVRWKVWVRLFLDGWVRDLLLHFESECGTRWEMSRYVKCGSRASGGGSSSSRSSTTTRRHLGFITFSLVAYSIVSIVEQSEVVRPFDEQKYEFP